MERQIRSTIKVVGIPMAQNIHCPYCIGRTSASFMPRTPEMNVKGRKMTVAAVKT
jgi:phosphoribulokinase